MVVNPRMAPVSDGDDHADSPSAKWVQKPALPDSEDPGGLDPGSHAAPRPPTSLENSEELAKLGYV